MEVRHHSQSGAVITAQVVPRQFQQQSIGWLQQEGIPLPGGIHNKRQPLMRLDNLVPSDSDNHHALQSTQTSTNTAVFWSARNR